MALRIFGDRSVRFSVGILCITFAYVLSDMAPASVHLSRPKRSQVIHNNATIEKIEGEEPFSEADPALLMSCGPAQLMGHSGFGTKFGNWLPWSEIRSGTVCRRVSFKRPFVNANDMRLFVSADRTESDGSGHLTPIVWAEKVEHDAFDICVHFISDFDDIPSFWKESIMASWWVIDSESKPPPNRQYLGRVTANLEQNSSVCKKLAEKVNPDSNTVLVTTSYPGLIYEKWYAYEGAKHTSRESVVSWLAEGENSTFEVCAKRLYNKIPSTIEGAAVDILSISRSDKRYTGLAKIQLGGYGRGCVFVDVDLTKVGSADDENEGLPHVFVQTRLNVQDREANGESPQMAAWVEHKLGRGFTVCAKNLARGRRKAKHSIQVHWIAVHGPRDGEGSSVCRQGAVKT